MNTWIEKARDLHRRAPVIDAHFDLVPEVYFRRHFKGEQRVIADHYLDLFSRSGHNVIICAVYVEDLFLENGGALKNALDQIALFREEVRSCGAKARLIETSSDLEGALAGEYTGFLLSLEGVEPLVGDLKMVEIFHTLGVRAMGLTWSRRNEAADGCEVEGQTRGRVGGLSTFGRNLIQRAHKRHILIDAAHLSIPGFWDLVQTITDPFIVSHSNAAALCEIPRNLDDDQIRAVADGGGVVCVNAIRSMIRSDREPTVDDLADHIDHMVSLVGAEHVGYGFDLCDPYIEHSPFASMTALLGEHEKNDLFKDHEEAILLTAELLRRGYTENDVIAIVGGNLARVLFHSLPASE